MAVPQNLPTGSPNNVIDPQNGGAGPWFVNGAVYICTIDNAASEISILRVADPSTGSFVAQDTANQMSAETYTTCGAYLDGDHIYVIAGDPSIEDWRYGAFDTVSDTWVSAVTDDVIVTSGTTNPTRPEVLIRGAGDPVVGTYVDAVKFMGTNYWQVELWQRSTTLTAGGSWTTAVAVSNTQDEYHWCGPLLLGLSNRTHIFYQQRAGTSGSADAMHVTYNSSDAFQTRQVVDANAFAGTSQGPMRYNGGVRYDVSGTIHLRVGVWAHGTGGPGLELHQWEADSADNPTWTIDVQVQQTGRGGGSTQSGNGDMCVDDTTASTIHAVFAWRNTGSFDGDIYYNTQADGGSYDGSPTDKTGFASDTTGIDVCAIGPSAYDYGGGSVIGVVYVDGSQTKYNEITLSAAVTINVPTGGLVLAGQAPTRQIDEYRRPGAGALVLAGLAPTKVIGKNIPAGTLTLAGQLPTCFQAFNFFPPAGTLTLAGVAPTLLVSVTLNIPVGTLTFAGLAPALSIGFAIDVPVGALVLTGQAPALQFDFKMQPDAGALVFTGHVPALGLNTLIDVPVGALVVAGLAPGALVPVIMQPGVGVLTLHTEPAPLGFGIDMPFDTTPC